MVQCVPNIDLIILLTPHTRPLPVPPPVPHTNNIIILSASRPATLPVMSSSYRVLNVLYISSKFDLISYKDISDLVLTLPAPPSPVNDNLEKGYNLPLLSLY